LRHEKLELFWMDDGKEGVKKNWINGVVSLGVWMLERVLIEELEVESLDLTMLNEGFDVVQVVVLD
jgi:hypothetical protein